MISNHLKLFCIFILLAFSYSLAFAGDDDDPHLPLFDASQYPSAAECGTCHPAHYREWSVSPHAYAMVSPVFNAMHETILILTNGSNGDFCIRCHTPIGMQVGESVAAAVEDRLPISREGITCIACHRVASPLGKISGRRPIKSGDIYEPVVGPKGGEELARAIKSGDYRITDKAGEVGRPVHKDVHAFFELTQPGFCGTCHDVNFVNGFRLEEAFSEFKTSPSARRGETCVDCHMSPTPGQVSEFPQQPAAEINGKTTQPRKRTNHMFIGPDYSIVHPGVFPHNGKAQAMASIKEWLLFDWQSGWGTDNFEDEDHEDSEFPERWQSIDDRYDARELIDDNLGLLQEAQDARLKILQHGFQLSDIKLRKATRRSGIKFDIDIINGTDGHGVPTGFDAERLVFLQVSVKDEKGHVVYQSGDLDPNGDVRDLHSSYVISGKLPLDRELMSLQSKFVTRMIRGGDREQVLAVNQSPSPLPFVRPTTTPNILTGAPRGVRKHKANIEPLGKRTASYHAKDAVLPGRYSVTVKLIAGMVPVNLLHEISSVGFDYGLNEQEVARRVIDGHQILWQRELEVSVP